ncbi:MAG: DUF4440 domain-containing protein [Pseudomonadota bacterium]
MMVIRNGALALTLAVLSVPAMADHHEAADCPGVVDEAGHGPDPGSAEYEAACQYQRDLAAVRAHSERWKALYEAADFDVLETLYMPDAVLMSAGVPRLNGPAAIVGRFRQSHAAGWRATIDFLEEDLTIDGDRADLIALYWMTVTPPEGDAIEAMGRSWLTFQRGADGEWRLWRDMDNRAPDVTAGMRPAREGS